jgi:hypothetical protein
LTRACAGLAADFKTRVDVQLMDWARKDLPNKCVDVARETFIDEFEGIVKVYQKRVFNQ